MSQSMPPRRRSRPIAGRRRSTRPLVGVAVLAAAVVGAVPAWAYWTASGSASASVTASQLSAPATVTATATSPTRVTVKVTAAPTSGPTPTGYVVKRDGTTVCANVALNANCLDTGLAQNTAYTYTVGSNLQSWTSAATTSASATTNAVGKPSIPALTAASDSNPDGDGFTNLSPVFTGNAPAGSTVQLVLDSTTLITPTVTVPGTTGTGNWTITPTAAPSSNVTHTVVARATIDGASTDSDSFSFLVDTVRPTLGTPTVTCSVPGSNSYCRGQFTVTVPSISDPAPSSGLGASVSYSGTNITAGTASINAGTAVFTPLRADSTTDTTLSVGVSDGAGNASTSAQALLSRTDRSTPTVSGLALANGQGGNSGRAEAGDQVTIDFSDSTSGFAPGTICQTWANQPTTVINGNSDVTVTIANNAASPNNDTLSVSVTSGCGTGTGAFNLGTIALGGNYVTTGSLVFRGNNTPSTLTWSGSRLTITLGRDTNSGTAASTAASSAVPVLTPSSALTDRAGNPMSANPVNGSSSRL